MWKGAQRLIGALGAIGALVCVLGTAPARADTLELPVPKVVVYPGDVLSEELIASRAFVARTVAREAVLLNRDGLIGKVAKKTLLPGQPIPINAIRDAYLVNQGKPTRVVFQQDGLIITAQALALQNGGEGDQVSLRNTDSGLVIKGTVQADGSVRVGAQ